MKIQYIINGFGAVLCACTLFSSCGDDLNALPSQSKVDGNVVVDAKSAEIALNGVYYQYAMCGTDYYDVASTMCSSYYEAYPADIAGTLEYYQGAYLFEVHGNSNYASYSNWFWQSYYQAVNVTNEVIEQVEGSSDNYYSGNRKAEILGEAHAMRALSFYNIFCLFGYTWDYSSPYGIILRTQKSTVSTLPLDRSSVADTYAQILSDCDFAINNAPTSGEKYQATSWMAMGLKARLLLMRGQEGDYAEAATLCQDIIDKGGFTLDNYNDIFHTNGLNSPEVIFGIQPNDNQSNCYETYYYRNSPQFFPTDSMLNLMKDDPRMSEIFYPVKSMQFGFNDDGTYYIYYDTKYVIAKHLDPAKATVNSSGTTIFSNDELEETQYQMRLSEIYLMLAEAQARQGLIDQARANLEAVEKKAGITDFTAVENATTQHDMLQQIFNEYLRNLSYECGIEHEVCLRFPEDIVLGFNPQYAVKQANVLAIPTDEFKYNNALTADDQNPGYSAE
ncbi:MAG: RagB/SusD family nutrient uptake outer membrane protein [Prevotella sp.]|jgi:hypothetical protein